MERPTGTDSARVIQVIETRAKKGLGSEKDPAREIVQYWDFDGNLLASSDPDVHLLLAKNKAEYEAVKASVVTNS